jgi:predicted branched-subunit amino acid permease
VGDVRAGAVAIAPILLGVAPFALVTGAISVNDGTSVLQASAFSVLAFAGASQIAALNLLASGGSVLVAVTTATIINLRFVLYSAALSPRYAGRSALSRLVGAYLLTDHAFAVTVSRDDRRRRDDVAYYLGAALAFWVTWQACLLAGALGGRRLPDDLPLQFLVSLSFLALLVPMLKDRPSVVAALAAGVAMALLRPAWGSEAVVACTAIGVVAGYAVSTRRGRRAPAPQPGTERR